MHKANINTRKKKSNMQMPNMQMPNIGEYTEQYTKYMEFFDKECKSDERLTAINNQRKLDLAVLLFKIFVSTYKNNLNKDTLNFAMGIINKVGKSSNVDLNELTDGLSKLGGVNNQRNKKPTPRVEEINGGSRKIKKSLKRNKKNKKNKNKQKGGSLKIKPRNLNDFDLQNLSKECRKCIDEDFYTGLLDERGDPSYTEQDNSKTTLNKIEAQARENYKYCKENCKIEINTNGTFFRRKYIHPFRDSRISKLFIHEDSPIVDDYAILMTAIVYFTNIGSITGSAKSKLGTMRAIELQKLLNESPDLLKNEDGELKREVVLPNVSELDLKVQLKEFIERETSALEEEIRSQVESMKAKTIQYKESTAPAALEEAKEQLRPKQNLIATSRSSMYFQLFSILLVFMNQQRGLIYGDFTTPDQPSHQFFYEHFETGTSVLAYILFIFQFFYIMSNIMSSNNYVGALQHVLLLVILIMPFVPGIVYLAYQSELWAAPLRLSFPEQQLSNYESGQLSHFGLEQHRHSDLDYSESIRTAGGVVVTGVTEMIELFGNMTHSFFGSGGSRKNIKKLSKKNKKKKYSKKKYRKSQSGGEGWFDWAKGKATTMGMLAMFGSVITVLSYILNNIDQAAQKITPNYSLIVFGLGVLITFFQIKTQRAARIELQNITKKEMEKLKKTAEQSMGSIDVRFAKPPGGSGGLATQMQDAQAIGKMLKTLQDRHVQVLQAQAQKEQAQAQRETAQAQIETAAATRDAAQIQANATNRQTTAITQGAQLQADATAAAANTQVNAAREATTRQATATAAAAAANNLDLPDAPTSPVSTSDLVLSNLERRLARLRSSNEKPAQLMPDESKDLLVPAQ